MTRHRLAQELKSYNGHLLENAAVPRFLDLLTTVERCFYRDCIPDGHITGSAMLVNGAADKVLLNRHKILGKWLCFGGHADGEEDIRAVALREVIEESGISSVAFVTEDIFDIDVHPIPRNDAKNEGAHFHFDILFLFRTEDETYQMSDESLDLRW